MWCPTSFITLNLVSRFFTPNVVSLSYITTNMVNVFNMFNLAVNVVNVVNGRGNCDVVSYT